MLNYNVLSYCAHCYSLANNSNNNMFIDNCCGSRAEIKTLIIHYYDNL